MSGLAAGLLPVVLLIATGWAARASGLVPERAWDGFERVMYAVAFPALVIHALAGADLGSLPLLTVGACLVLPILTIAGLLALLRAPLARWIGLDGPAFTSVFQGSTRWNTFVGVALAAGLHGPRGTALAAVAIAAMIPLLNLLAVAVLLRHGTAPAGEPREGLLSALARNPFILSALGGVTLAAFGLRLPPPVMSWLGALGGGALGGGLLLVGAGLDLAQLRRPGAAAALATALKLVALPLMAGGLAMALGLQGADRAVVVLCAAVPTASASYVLARRMGGDAPLMALIVTLQTLLSALTLPLALLLLG